MTGIVTQSAQSILEEVDEFYFGGSTPWFHGTEIVELDGKPRLTVRMTHPDDDSNTEVVTFGPYTASKVRSTFFALLQNETPMCCAQDIVTEGIGFGCAQDLDLILQRLCYGQVTFA